jgi:ring-1,2-phenylacetyl-CoA epoxidase subunit PaaD
VSAVVDPEIRVVTIEELGILRDVRRDDATGRVTVTITPTYSGCPAMDVIRADIRRALHTAGYDDVAVETVLRPAWSTDMISDAGRDKLAAAGIAPPSPVSARSEERAPQSRTNATSAGSRVVGVRLSVRCPRCGSPDTQELSRFGATACKSLWRCRECREPFDRVKPL